MVYLSNFKFAPVEKEEYFGHTIKRTCYNTWYPFGILTKNRFSEIDFAPITILYGGNGSGKSTALNIIAEKLGLHRDTAYNRSNFYEDYLRFCRYETEEPISSKSRIITSDDVFDFMINLRYINNGLDIKREELFEDYLENKHADFRFSSMADYERLKKINAARSTTQSQYVKNNLMGNLREHSNGESAFLYFQDKIEEDALYLLDEPENSLSPERQMELVKFLEESVSIYGCQFVIATHSPFILALKNAKIYDMDACPVDLKSWTELGNVRAYYEFFKEHEDEFVL